LNSFHEYIKKQKFNIRVDQGNYYRRNNDALFEVDSGKSAPKQTQIVRNSITSEYSVWWIPWS